jgi:hypothetical protein
MTKLLSRLLNLALSVVIGALAGALFKQLWKLTAGEEQAPQAADPKRSWKEILPAAALQGALFATVKAAASSTARARDRHAPRQAGRRERNGPPRRRERHRGQGGEPDRT